MKLFHAALTATALLLANLPVEAQLVNTERCHRFDPHKIFINSAGYVQGRKVNWLSVFDPQTNYIERAGKIRFSVEGVPPEMLLVINPLLLDFKGNIDIAMNADGCLFAIDSGWEVDNRIVSRVKFIDKDLRISRWGTVLSPKGVRFNGMTFASNHRDVAFLSTNGSSKLYWVNLKEAEGKEVWATLLQEPDNSTGFISKGDLSPMLSTQPKLFMAQGGVSPVTRLVSIVLETGLVTELYAGDEPVYGTGHYLDRLYAGYNTKVAFINTHNGNSTLETVAVLPSSTNETIINEKINGMASRHYQYARGEN